MTDFADDIELLRAERANRIQYLSDAFAASSAITALDKHRGRVLLVKSEDTGGGLRVTEFLEDGPRGHTTAATERELYDRMLGDFSKDVVFSPVTEQYVMDWTSTPAFVQGSKLVAFTQADNTYRYLAMKAGIARDQISKVVDKAHELSGFDIESGTAVLERHIKVLVELHPELAMRQNPPRRIQKFVQNGLNGYGGTRSFRQNPPWVSAALADSYDVINGEVPPEWQPRFASVKAGRKDAIVADLLEYGCGAYGCVIATLDPGTVLKVTSDETEAEFAAALSTDLVAPICVEYKMVVRLSERHEGRQIHLLWRESAEHVGNIEKALGRHQGRLAMDLIDAQHAAGQAAYYSLMTSDAAHSTRELSDWVKACKAMARGKVPELRALGAGLVQVYDQQRILFGDIHSGNLGRVTRDGIRSWVISDPGHVAVIQD